MSSKDIDKTKRNTEAKREWRKNNRERARKTNLKYRLNNKEKVKDSYKKWVAKNREKVNSYNRNWREVNGRWRDSDLKKKYGIGVDDYEKLLTEQNKMCAICGIDESKVDKRLFVDHDHKTGQVRGLLCRNCNFILGYAKDDTDTLYNAIGYLEINAKQR